MFSGFVLGVPIGLPAFGLCTAVVKTLLCCSILQCLLEIREVLLKNTNRTVF